MDVIAINGSPRAKKSNTYQMLFALLEGMEQTKAKTEIIHIALMDIHYCLGCRFCKDHPGKCCINDDMNAFYEKLAQADWLIFGTPLHYFNMTGMMKNFIDRLLPIDGKRGIRTKSQKILLVSPCGLLSTEQFSPLISTFKYMAKMTDREYLGEILRTTANVQDEDKRKKYFQLLRLSGTKLIESGKIEKKLIEELHAPWMSIEEWERLNPWAKVE